MFVSSSSPCNKLVFLQHSVLLLDLQHPIFPLLPSMPLFKFTVWDIPCAFSTFFCSVYSSFRHSVFWALYMFSVSSHLFLEHLIFLHIFLRQPANLRTLTLTEVVSKQWSQIYAVIFILVLLIFFNHLIEIFCLSSHVSSCLPVETTAAWTQLLFWFFNQRIYM